ncbi:MAG: DUF5683 domain-containing protein [Flavobacteriales bacterium]|nr:DUF5683 domain-containing protein [Flavobacteriales bacterium]MCW8912300.1 DUF5683 domain-containing protein [Flavobacteriales bacterium]MCW8937461.1 DUF5683 domain-containing protein [Flavobacteriales bacterium]MCW8939226.1 DUF5683 domain-containing protein [Flavobacteriales bacterium]MCW8968364.1 DUF5683 domain-containing protein [Flavobacteriales bacterium]
MLLTQPYFFFFNYRSLCWVFVVLLGISTSVNAQDSLAVNSNNNKVPDTLLIDIAKPHSPAKAAIMSTILPGLGQAYNKKYWKIPIIYGAIGTSIYFAVENNKTYDRFKTALSERLDNDPNTVDEFDGRLSVQSLESNYNFYQRNRDLSIIVAGIFYALNIVDASVDAHLYSFPKNDNLSLRIVPTTQLTANNNIMHGASLVFNF